MKSTHRYTLLSLLLGCGPEIDSPRGIGYNSTAAYSPTVFTPACDAGCPSLPSAPGQVPPPSAPPPPDASSLDAAIDANWEGLCVAYGYPGQSGPVCRRRGNINETDEGGILGCDPVGAPCCIDPSQQYAPIDPAFCTAGNWAPNYPQPIPEQYVGQCVRILSRESSDCQAYVVDPNSPMQITAVDSGKKSCDDLGNPCCYVAAENPLQNINPTCQDPDTVTWIDDSNF